MPHQFVPERNRRLARAMRSEQTEAEQKLWTELRTRRLMGLKFRRQLPIGPYIVDFACPEHRLIVELDGAGHSDDRQASYDQSRTQDLSHLGWTVLRFWNNEVTGNTGAVCDHIIRTLEDKGAVFS